MHDGPDRGLLARRLRPALPPAADGPRLRLPGDQRRRRPAHAHLVPALAAAFHRPTQGASRLRPRYLRAARARQPAHLRPHPAVRGGHRPLRPQPRPLGAGGAARPLALRGYGPRGDAGTVAVPGDRGASLPVDPRPQGILLVPVASARVNSVDTLLPRSPKTTSS